MELLHRSDWSRSDPHSWDLRGETECRRGDGVEGLKAEEFAALTVSRTDKEAIEASLDASVWTGPRDLPLALGWRGRDEVTAW
jgi:hypothetical protein